MGWNLGLCSLPPLGRPGAALRGPAEAQVGLGQLGQASLLGDSLPVPSPWSLLLGQAGAIFGIGLGLWGWFQMFQCEQEKMGTDGWWVPFSGSCWEQVIFRVLLTLWGLVEPPLEARPSLVEKRTGLLRGP